MTSYFSKRISFMLLIAIFSISLIYADGGGERDRPIIIQPIDTVKPVKPFAPSYLKLSACLVGDEVVVTSNVDVMAEVKIYDAEINQTYYNATVALAPDCRCPLPQVDAKLTLRVIIDDKTYQGTFQR